MSTTTTKNTKLVYSWNDAGNAQRIADTFKGQVLYAHDIKKWMVWEASRWVEDQKDHVMNLARQVPRQMVLEAIKIKDKEIRVRLLAFASKSGNHYELKSMLAQAASLPEVASAATKFDADPWLLGTPSGVLNLRTGALRACHPDDLITKHTAVPYVPDAECPRWMRFLEEIFEGNEELISYVHRWAGYLLTGDVGEQVFLFLFGIGKNGKSTLIKHMADVMGDYAAKSPTSLFVESRAHDPHRPAPEVVRLKGLRFTYSSEPEEGAKLSEAKLRELTGGEPIAARDLHKSTVEFVPQVKLFMIGNHRPTVTSTTFGTWRRVQLLNFSRRFSDSEVDHSLDELLRSEWEGILAWAVRGCLKWQELGLNPPATVIEAVENYRSQEDVIGLFLGEATAPEGFVSKKELFLAYQKWTADEGMKFVVTRRQFNKKLVERGTEQITRTGTDGWRLSLVKEWSARMIEERLLQKARMVKCDDLDD